MEVSAGWYSMKLRRVIRTLVERILEKVCSRLADRYGIPYERCCREFFPLLSLFLLSALVYIGLMIYIIQYLGVELTATIMFIITSISELIKGGRAKLKEALNRLDKAIYLLVHGITVPLKYFIFVFPIVLSVFVFILPMMCIARSYVIPSAILLAHVISVMYAYFSRYSRRSDEYYREFMELFTKDVRKYRIASAVAIVTVFAIIFSVLLVIIDQQRATTYLMYYVCIVIAIIVMLFIGTVLGSKFAPAFSIILLQVIGLAMYFIISSEIALITNSYAQAISNSTTMQEQDPALLGRDLAILGLAFLFLLFMIFHGLSSGNSNAEKSS